MTPAVPPARCASSRECRRAPFSPCAQLERTNPLARAAVHHAVRKASQASGRWPPNCSPRRTARFYRWVSTCSPRPARDRALVVDANLDLLLDVLDRSVDRPAVRRVLKVLRAAATQTVGAARAATRAREARAPPASPARRWSRWSAIFCSASRICACRASSPSSTAGGPRESPRPDAFPVPAQSRRMSQPAWLTSPAPAAIKAPGRAAVPATSQQVPGASPGRRVERITSPRLPARHARGDHETRASQVVGRSVLPPLASRTWTIASARDSPSSVFVPPGGAVALPRKEVPTWRCLTSCAGCSGRGRRRARRHQDSRSPGDQPLRRPVDMPPAHGLRRTRSLRGQRNGARSAHHRPGQRGEHRAAHPSRQPRQQPHPDLQRPTAQARTVHGAPGSATFDAAQQAPAQPAAPAPIAQLKRAAAVTQRPVTQPKPTPAARPQPVAVPTPAPTASPQPAIGAARASAPKPACASANVSGPKAARPRPRPRSSRCIGGWSPPAHRPGSPCARSGCASAVRTRAAGSRRRCARAPAPLRGLTHRRGPARALRAAALAHRGGHRPGARRST